MLKEGAQGTGGRESRQYNDFLKIKNEIHRKEVGGGGALPFWRVKERVGVKFEVQLL
jgi:hypothetical protein